GDDPSRTYFFRTGQDCPVANEERSINNQKISVRVGESGWKAPDGEAGSPALVHSRFAGWIVELPCNSATFRPTSSLGPDQESLAFLVCGDCRMFAADSTHRRDWLRDFSRFWIHVREINFSGGFPGSD